MGHVVRVSKDPVNKTTVFVFTVVLSGIMDSFVLTFVIQGVQIVLETMAYVLFVTLVCMVSFANCIAATNVDQTKTELSLVPLITVSVTLANVYQDIMVMPVT